MDTPYGQRLFLSVSDGLVSAVNEEGTLFPGAQFDANLPFDGISFPELISREQKAIAACRTEQTGFVLTTGCHSLKQARAAVFAARKEEIPIMICMEADEEGENPSGGSAVASLIALQELGILAFGITGALPPKECAEVCEALAPFAKVPLLAAPTAGQPNPILPELYDLAPEKMAELIPSILDCGVSILMENAGVTPEHVERIREQLFTYIAPPVPEREDEEEQIILSNAMEFFVISNERLEFTEPIACTQDMSDDLLSAEEDSFDVLQIVVETPDDALVFEDNEHLAGLPVMFCSDDEISLKAALLLYDGRAMVDSETAIEPEVLQEIADKYGCVIY